MSHFYQEKILQYSAEQLYKIIIDVESYPKFLPWCKFSQITKIYSPNNFEADLTISFKSIMQKYTSLVVGDFDENNKIFTVNATAINGPFKKLETKWKVVEVANDLSKIVCQVDFEFSSAIIGKMLATVFNIASQKMITAFENRAKFLYHKH